MSVQIVGIAFDVLGKTERMVPHKFFRAARVARFQGFDNVHVVADRAIRPVLLDDRLAPDHAHVREEIFCEIDQNVVVAELDDALMKLDVDVGIFVEMCTQLAVLESREHLAQAGDFTIRRGLGDQTRRHAFERGPGGDHLDHLAFGFSHHIDAATGYRAYKALAFELGHRFANRRPANSEILRKFPLIQPDVVAISIDIHRHDRVFQRGISLVLETWRAVYRLQGRMSHERRARGSCATGEANTVGFTLLTHDWYTIYQTPADAAITLFYGPTKTADRVIQPAAACRIAGGSRPPG